MIADRKSYRPQEGPQMEFFRNPADIVIYGGAAGAGKTYALLLEALWNHDIPGFNCVIFRKNSTQIRNPGGLWDTSHQVYHDFEGIAKETTLEWNFPKDSVIKFAHLDNESDKYSWQGSQICLVGFDELTHFSWGQFVYMLSRNRSICGVAPYIRATCNPHPDSWVRKFINWWIDDETGYPIMERSGQLRYFIVQGDETIWSSSKEELQEKYPEAMPKSVSFIAATVYDNRILLENDPSYLSNLYALPKFEREQLLHGNWNIRPSGGLFFKKNYFEVREVLPRGLNFVRYWDRAATKKTETNDPDHTVGIKLGKDKDGIFYVADMVRLQESPLKIQQAIKNTAAQDGYTTRIGLEQDPGQAGVSEVDQLIRTLSGFAVKPYKVTQDKMNRALPVSAQAEAGNIIVLKGHWNDAFFHELENFPEGSHDDIVDALSGAFLMHTESSYDLIALSKL